MNEKAVIVFSGGLDSTTCLALAKQQGFDCTALTFDYQQRHCAELNAAQAIAHRMGVTDHRIVTLNMGQFGGSALTDQNIAVPDFEDTTQVPVTYVPARNSVFLSIALALAEAIEAYDIFIGVSHIDYSGYPDCRPKFIEAFQNMANLATKTAIEGHPIKIHAPLIHLDKAQTIKLGIQAGVDYSMTVSCYRADNEGRACGSCDSCVYRKQGFAQAGVADPTRYQS
jgi:7-cyano-7-deazaguanine synthase